ncbi:MAG TPA: MMPL family transporter [Gemmatimonadaceae bacterium]|nr:MMPL family transporter [Gemmatimonadaceae bacterium]
MMAQSIARFVVRHPRAVVVAWALALAAAVPGALLLTGVAQGGSEAIRGSDSRAVMERMDERFGTGAAHLVPVVVASDSLSTRDPRFQSAVAALETRLAADSSVRGVMHFWNSGTTELLGRDGKSALLLVQPAVTTLGDAEAATSRLRGILDGAAPGMRTYVTGMSAMFFDLNRQSAADLLRAEMVGIPLTLIVLFLVFRTLAATGAAIAVAVTAVLVSSAVLYLMHGVIPATVLAQNVITMIGLGAGTDYALFVLMHHRDERAHASDADAAIVGALSRAGPAVLASGLAVIGGFASLFLVNARFVHSLALGGIAVVCVALLATLTLLPALMHFAGARLVRRHSGAAEPSRMDSAWSRWSMAVMRRPRLFLAVGLAISALCAWPALESRSWSFGARDLPAQTESRLGFEILERQYEPGWSAPTVVLLESEREHGVWQADAQRAILSRSAALRADPRVAQVLGFPRVLEALGPASPTVSRTADLPAPVATAARSTVTADGRTAIMLVVLRESPESHAAQDVALALRDTVRDGTGMGGLGATVGGGSAILADFDAEMLRSLRKVMLAVIAVTFVLLFVFLRSITVPIKAIVANLLSVFAAYGFLVVVFQYGVGASLLGITPPGGLNSFVVLMLFTILFGLSMDYEIFLLSQIRHEYLRTRDTTASVAAGLSHTAAVISGAAAVMVCLFGSFGFFGLTASREFGLGLAFAVAFDATVVRLLLVPVTMRLMGRWNWWPGLR